MTALSWKLGAGSTERSFTKAIYLGSSLEFISVTRNLTSPLWCRFSQPVETIKPDQYHKFDVSTFQWKNGSHI